MKTHKILVVDDDGAAQQLLQSTLTSAGYEVVTATDPGEGVAAARANNPDLYIVDTTFRPDPSSNWDGFTLTQWLHHIHVGDTRPILFVTADDVEQHKQHATQVGAAAILSKPLDAHQVLATVSECLAPMPAAA
jgi:DNA-binding response OmpR family regulator